MTLVVATAQAIAISPSSFTFSYAIGGTVPPSQTLVLSGGPLGQSFTASASNAADWLRLGASTVTAPGGLEVSTDPSLLGAGVYSGAITLSANNVTPQIVPVTLIVTAAQTLSVSPTALTFNVTPGATAPAQLLSVSAPGANPTFTALPSSAGNWLVLDLSTPGVVSAAANAFLLTPGTYFGAITINATHSNASQTVQVTLVVSPSGVITAAPASLTFDYQLGSSPPGSQSVALTAVTALSFTAAASSAGSWLSVSSSAAATPALLTVSISPSSLSPGSLQRGHRDYNAWSFGTGANHTGHSDGNQRRRVQRKPHLARNQLSDRRPAPRSANRVADPDWRRRSAGLHR